MFEQLPTDLSAQIPIGLNKVDIPRLVAWGLSPHRAVMSRRVLNRMLKASFVIFARLQSLFVQPYRYTSLRECLPKRDGCVQVVSRIADEDATDRKSVV